MKPEIEVKFIDIDIEDIRHRLERLGAVCQQPMRLMRRTVFHTVDHDQGAYLRVRDEGDKVTMTYKAFAGHGIYDASEAEVVVADYEIAIEILTRTGLEAKSVQETRRETWRLAEVEVVIDEWPWLKPFIEIEGDSESSVRQVAEKLGYKWEDSVTGPVTVAYRLSYPALPADMVMDDVSEIRFDAEPPERLHGR